MVKATLAVGALLGAVAISCASFGEAYNCVHMPDVDFVGYDLWSFAAPHGVSQCCEPCSKDNRCVAYTWSPYNGGMCYLKSGAGEIKTGVAGGLVSGAPIKPCTIWANVDFIGHDYRNLPATNTAQCCAYCRAIPGCRGFTRSADVCYLKNWLGELQSNRPDLVSGTI